MLYNNSKEPGEKQKDEGKIIKSNNIKCKSK